MRPAPERQAFTLIELLVVIAIIAILLSLAAAGAFQIMETSKASNTETILQTVDQLRQQAWAKVLKDAKTETPISPAVVYFAGNDMKRARVIWMKLRAMEAFPQSYAEIQSPFPYSSPFAGQGPLIPLGQRHYMASYQRAVNSANLSNNKAATQSAACLLMALTQVKVVGTGVTMDQLRTADTDGDGLPELVDGWGNPLLFFRFPIGNGGGLQSVNPPPAGNNKAANYRDPLDPDGLLTQAGWQREVFNNNVHLISGYRGPPPTYYTIPVEASSGRNGRPGVDGFLNVTNTNDENDNIYSFRVKLGQGG
jgi:prepilin-type N-terminal cleavage/methylation domain-containing protein